MTGAVCVYNGGQLSQMTVTTVTETADGQTSTQTHTVDLTYDASGNPQTMTYDDVTYYYTVNIQGDVTGIVDESGNVLVRYTYQAYGTTTFYGVPTGSDGSTLRQINPLTYRGYVYDKETKLYYLQSRYYNRTSGRFINADAYASTGQGLLGNNMFAYCGNNSVMHIDPCGTCFHRWDFWNDCEDCKKTIEEVKSFLVALYADYKNFNAENSDVSTVYSANYISSYNGVPVIYHDIDFLTSWSFGGVIFLKQSKKQDTQQGKENTLNHEYGHALQERNMGTRKYIGMVAIPSITANLLGREFDVINENYFNLPWEYEADVRGRVNREHAWWAPIVYVIYSALWGE